MKYFISVSKYGGILWYKNRQWHRLDRPAKERPNGHKEWWVNDIEYTEEEFKRIR